jgi:hypothetical protein
MPSTGVWRKNGSGGRPALTGACLAAGSVFHDLRRRSYCAHTWGSTAGSGGLAWRPGSPPLANLRPAIARRCPHTPSPSPSLQAPSGVIQPRAWICPRPQNRSCSFGVPPPAFPLRRTENSCELGPAWERVHAIPLGVQPLWSHHVPDGLLHGVPRDQHRWQKPWDGSLSGWSWERTPRGVEIGDAKQVGVAGIKH